MQTIRVLLVDDHAVLRAGLRSLLNAEPDIQVVGEAGDGSEALKQIGLLMPDIAVMDLTIGKRAASVSSNPLFSARSGKYETCKGPVSFT